MRNRLRRFVLRAALSGWWRHEPRRGNEGVSERALVGRGALVTPWSAVAPGATLPRGTNLRPRQRFAATARPDVPVLPGSSG